MLSRIRFHAVIAATVFLSQSVSAQVTQAWFDPFDQTSQDLAIGMATDAAGNAYVVGVTNGDEGILLKYDRNGNRLWEKPLGFEPNPYDPEQDGLVADSAGNLYVTGNPGTGLNLYKIDSNGNIVWSVPADMEEIKLDSAGNVYTFGSTGTHPLIVAVVTRYDTTTGNVLWTASYDGPGDFDDFVDLAFDADGNVIGASRSGRSSGTLETDLAVAWYDRDTGSELRVGRTDWSTYSVRVDPTGVAVDGAGNVVVVGTYGLIGGGGSGIFVKLDGNTGDVLFGGDGLVVDGSSAIDVIADSDGNVVIAGVNDTGNLFVEKRPSDPQTTSLVWRADLSETGTAIELLLDSADNAYVLAWGGVSGQTVYRVAKVDKFGVGQWTVDHQEATGFSGQEAYEMALGISGDVFVTGTALNIPGGILDITTVKFEQAAANNTAAGVNVPVLPVDAGGTGTPVTLTFDQVDVAGETVLNTNLGAPPIPSGFKTGSPHIVYDLSTNAQFTGNVEVCINYGFTGFGDESNLKLYHHDGSSWQDITTSLDTGANEICGLATSLSPFVILEPEGDPVTVSAQATVNGNTFTVDFNQTFDSIDRVRICWVFESDLFDPGETYFIPSIGGQSNTDQIQRSNQELNITDPGVLANFLDGQHADAFNATVGTINMVQAQFTVFGTSTAPPLPTGDIQVSTSTLNFGNVQVGNTATETFTVTNNGPGPTLITNIRAQPYDILTFPNTVPTQFSVTNAPTLPFTLLPGAPLQIDVEYAPTTEGLTSGFVEVYSDDPDACIVGVNLNSVGELAPPALVFQYPAEDPNRVRSGFEILHDNQIGSVGGFNWNRHTVMFWVKPTAVVNNWSSLWHRGENDHPRLPGLFFHPGNLRIHYRQATVGNSNAGLDPNPPLNLNEWNHVAISWNQGDVTVYYDGQPVDQATALGPTTPESDDVKPVYAANPSFRPPAIGLMEDVRIYDGSLSQAEILAAMVPPVTPPTADAGADKEAVVDEVVQLDGSGSSHPDNLPLSFSWTLQGPPGSFAALSNPSSQNPTFVPDVEGDYVAELTVTDPNNVSDTDQVTISAIACVTAPVGIVGWWRGEGNTSGVIGGSGTLLNGASFAPGKVGQAFSLDGSDDMVRVNDVSGLEPQHLTVETWVFAEGPGSLPDAIGAVVVSKDIGNALSAPFISYMISGPGTTGKFRAALGITDLSPQPDSGYPGHPTLFSTNSFSFNTWHHVAMTWDGSVLKLHVNGNVEGVLNLGPQTISYSGDPVTIGGHNLITGRDFDGRIDEPTVFSRALSDVEIKSIFEAGIAGKCEEIPPVAEAGPDQEGVVDEIVVLDGAGSFDPEGGPLTYEWSVLTSPPGASFTITPQPQPERADFTFSGPPGDWDIELKVADLDGLMATDQVTVRSSVAYDAIYWADINGRSINRSKLDGTDVKLLFSGPNRIGHVALDRVNERIYWTELDGGIIRRSDLLGSNSQVVVSGLARPLGIEVDPVGGHVYWADLAGGTIQRSDLDGANVTTIVPGAGSPVRIGLDVPSGHIYWAGSGLIRRADLDGSNAVTLISGLDNPQDVVPHAFGGKLYFAEAGNAKRVRRSNIDGSGVELLLSNAGANGLFLDSARGHLYLAESSGAIRRINTDGSGITQVASGGTPISVALGFKPPNQPPVANAGQDQIADDAVECTSPNGAQVSLDGSGTTDPDVGQVLTYQWLLNNVEIATGVMPQVTLPVGLYTITLVVTDPFEETSSDEVSVAVVDTAPPVVTAPPQPLVVEAVGPQGTPVTDPAVVAFLGLASAADVCDLDPDFSHDAPATLPLGETTVTWTAEDNSQNTATATQTIRVQDTTAPTVTAGALSPVECTSPAGAEVTVTATGSDAVTDAASLVFAWSVGGESSTETGASLTVTLALGDHTINVTATDGAGNTSESVNVTVTVTDTTPPSVVVQDLTVQLDATGNASITPGDVDNGSTDACGVKSLVLDVTKFTCENVGPNTVTLTVTDVFGNTSSATATITVEDNVAPTAVAQNVVLQLDASGNATLDPADVDNGSSDACGIAELTVSPSVFTCAEVGDNTVTLTVTDVNGNASTATATVTVEDNVAPTAVAQDVTVELDASGNGTLTAAEVDDGSSDACGIASLAIDRTEFTCTDVGNPVTVTLTVTDVNGNASTATATVTVEDNVAPTAVAQDVTVELDASGNGTLTAAEVDDGSSDACGIASLAIDRTEFTCTDVGNPVTVTLTVTDVNGNASTATATVTVEDNVAPTAVAQDVVLQLDAAGNATLDPKDVDNGSSDACGIAELTVSPSVFTCAEVGENTVTLTVTDVNGNASTATAMVTVEDNVAPTAVAQDVTIELDASGNGTLTAAEVDDGSSDACGIASLAIDRTEFTCADVGNPVTVTLTVTDANGNESTATAAVTVLDVTPPDLTVPSAITLEAQGPDGVPTDDTALSGWLGSATATDVCDADPQVVSDVMAGFVALGATTVTWTATDQSGNQTTASSIVTVVDTTPPDIVESVSPPPIECSGAQVNVTLTVIAEDIVSPVSALTYLWFDGDDVLSKGPSSEDFLDVQVQEPGDYVYKVVAIDEAGVHSPTPLLPGQPGYYTVTVEDTTPPEVTAALRQTWGKGYVDDDDDDEGWGGTRYEVELTVTDICDPDPALTAYITQPLTDPSFDLKYKSHKKKREIKIKRKKKGVEVELKGPSQGELLALLNEAISRGGFSVQDDQVLKLQSTGKPDDDKDDEKGSFRYRFDDQLNLEEAKGPGIKLTAFAVDAEGNISEVLEVVPTKKKATKVAAAKLATAETAFGLEQNHPNPFNPVTNVRYSLIESARVRVIVYNTLGQAVRVLVDRIQGAGVHTVQWDGRDAFGRTVSSGLYLYRLQAGRNVSVRKMVFAK